MLPLVSEFKRKVIHCRRTRHQVFFSEGRACPIAGDGEGGGGWGGTEFSDDDFIFGRGLKRSSPQLISSRQKSFGSIRRRPRRTIQQGTAWLGI